MYKYFRVNNFLYPISINPFLLTYIFLRSAQPLDYVFSLKAKRESVRNLKKIILSVAAFCKDKYYSRLINPRSLDIIELEFDGLLAKKVNKGIKILDLKNSEIIKVFSLDVSPEKRKKEIENLLYLSSLKSYSPPLMGYGKDYRYYREKYIRGIRADYFGDWKGWKENLENIVTHLIAEFITLTPQQAQRNNYLKKITDKALKKLSLSAGLQNEKERRIVDFLTQCGNEKLKAPSEMIYLGFSHGDFSQKHILIDKKNDYTVIDWETMGIRSILFDFYNCIFHRFNRRNIQEEAEIPLLIDGSLNILHQKIAEKSHDLALVLAKDIELNSDLYRIIYYIERICRIIEFQVMDNRMLDVILRWIANFKRYEGYLTTEEQL